MIDIGTYIALIKTKYFRYLCSYLFIIIKKNPYLETL